MDRFGRSKRQRAKALMLLFCTANLQRLMVPKRFKCELCAQEDWLGWRRALAPVF